MTLENSSAFLFDDVRVEPAMFRAFKAGNALQLEPKAFRLLLFLIENRGRLIEKDEILAAVWNGTNVTENALASEIAKLRKALADDSKTPKYIQTVRTQGYRFIAEVAEKNGSEQIKPLTSLSDGNETYPSQGISSEQLAPNAAAPHSEVKRKSWGKQLLIMGVIVALAVGTLIGLKIYKTSGSRATIPVSIRQITTWPGMDFDPSFSPDGESIA
jgi:DNA-binding winged helix-turn-helix (wHTH) protein